MEITIMTLGVVGLAAVATSAGVLAWRRRVVTNRLVERPSWTRRLGGWRVNDWFASDPVLFVGGDVATADCGAGADGGGAGCP